MKIYANQLNNHLNKGLSQCYMVFGDEPFQVDDSRKKIKSLAKQSGVEEFIRLTDDDQFDWLEVLDHCQAMSLFAEKKLIEIELTNSKIAKAGADIIVQVAQQLAQDNSGDTTLVIFGGKLDTSQTRTSWFKALDALGLYIPVYDIDGQHLQRWLQEQLQLHQLQMPRDAQQYLLDFTSGNLLACAQELEKIKMASQSPNIDLEHIKSLVSDQSRYTAFQLLDQLWLGNAQKCLTILSRLKQEELEPNILLWALQKDVMLIYELNQTILFQQDNKDILSRYKVWKNKQTQFVNLANRIPSDILIKAVEQLSQIDQVLKFHQHSDIYSLFAHVIIMLSGHIELADIPLPVDLELS